MANHRTRTERTIARSADVVGTGFLSGATVHLRFLPAPESTGIVFVRTDLKGRPSIRAIIDHVTGTERRTTIGDAPVQVGLVEHVMASLAGLQIDNCVVEVDAAEPPGLDGSSGRFVEALKSAGVILQAGLKKVWKITEPVVVQMGSGTIAIHPSDGDFRISYFLDYGHQSPIARQVYTQVITPSTFAQEIATCRTFLLEEEARQLHQMGLGSKTTAADLIIFGPRGPIDNHLRWANEPARHKVLDIIGDLAMLGMELEGHVVACRSGHPHNAALVKAIRQQMELVSSHCGRRAA